MKRHHPRLAVVMAAAAALAVGIAVVALVAGRTPGPGDGPEGDQESPAQGTPDPHDGASHQRTKHPRSAEGARAAAVGYATASQDWLYLPDDEVDAAVRRVATKAVGPALATETVSTLRNAREALAATPGRVWWLVRPLASSVERFQPHTARVVVWTVTVLSAADVALPQADWARVAVDLVWEAGAWRVQAVTETPGPTPMTGTKDRPWQPEPLDEALQGFQRVGAAADVGQAPDNATEAAAP